MRLGYVARRIQLPVTAPLREALAFDLDGNGTMDNAMGTILQTYISTGAQPQNTVDAALADGSLRVLLGAEVHDLTDDAYARLRVMQGLDADAPVNPADDFTGGETFAVMEDTRRAAMRADITAGALFAGPGRALVRFPLFGSEPMELDLYGVRVTAQISASSLPGGRLGGGVPDEIVHSSILPAVAGQMNSIVQADPGGDYARTILSLFDSNGDGMVTGRDLEENTLIAGLVRPDVDLCTGPCSTGEPGGDGTPDALSLAIGFEAVAATIEPWD